MALGPLDTCKMDKFGTNYFDFKTILPFLSFLVEATYLGILYHKSRIIDGQRWTKSAGKNINELLGQGLNLFTPVVDRWSPIAYSIGLWIHRDVGNHAGFETT